MAEQTPEATTDATPVVRYRDQVYGSYIRRLDKLGRQRPRVLGVLDYLKVIPGLAAKWRQIPGDYWNLTAGEGGVSFAVIACPCGKTPQVEVGLLETCECDRLYWFAHDEVLVANSPKRDAADPPTPAAS